MAFQSGFHFLQIPGPTNVPERVQRAMDRAVIDHRGPEFAALGRECLEGIKTIFKTAEPVIIYPSSGTGAWEAALVNTLSPGDRIVMFQTGQFATLWKEMAEKLGLNVTFVKGDWRHGVDPDALEAILAEDRTHAIKAVAVLQNETSTGVTSRIAEVRKAIDSAHHPALLLVDTISSLASIDYRHDEWGVDVTVGGSQKGLMLPPGMSFNAISQKARAAGKNARMPRLYWDWEPIIAMNAQGFWPATPPTTMLYGLREALTMLHEEGLENVFARHTRLADAARAAVRGWGFEMCALDPREYSNTLTTVMTPDGVDAEKFRATVLERFNMSLGTSFGPYRTKYFRIGHLGSFNELMLAATLAGVQMGFDVSGIAHGDGLTPALAVMSGSTARERQLASV